MAALAGHPGQEHRARVVPGTVRTRSGEHVLLRLVRSLVARFTVQLELLGQRHDRVIDRSVAQLTLDVVLGKVHLVKERGVLVLGQPLGEIVAHVAAVLVGRSRARGHPVVAGHARHHVPHVLRMVNDPAFHLQSRGRGMTPRAAADRLASGLPPEMAQEAGLLRDRQVVSLHDLRMTTRATQLLSASKLREVLPVVEPDAREYQLALEFARRMASRAKTGCVLDLGPRAGSIGSGDVLHDLVRRLHLTHRLGLDARGVMTLDALDIVVTRGGPGVVVGLHVVAVGAEARLGTVLDETERTQPCEQGEQYPDLNGPEQQLRPGGSVALACHFRSSPLRPRPGGAAADGSRPGTRSPGRRTTPGAGTAGAPTSLRR